MMRTFYILSLTIRDLAILASHILLELYVWIRYALQTFEGIQSEIDRFVIQISAYYNLPPILPAKQMEATFPLAKKLL